MKSFCHFPEFKNINIMFVVIEIVLCIYFTLLHDLTKQYRPISGFYIILNYVATPSLISYTSRCCTTRSLISYVTLPAHAPRRGKQLRISGRRTTKETHQQTQAHYIPIENTTRPKLV